MKDKPCDIPYCGVREAKIKSAKPVLDQQIVKWSYEWMHDRYQIHVKKDVQRLPAPWTNNPILRQVKFCNVRREHDRQSLNLINNIVKNDALSMADKMFNCVLFRMFNLWDPIQAIGGARTIKEFANIDLDVTRNQLREFEANGGKVFTNAFNTGGLKQCLAFPELVVNHKEQRFGGMMVNLICKDGSTQNMDYKEAKAIAEAEPDFYTIEGWEPYMPMRVIRSLKAFANKYPNYFHDLLRLGTPLEVYQRMYGDIEGLGPFLAYQIWVDFTYIPGYPFSENHFTVAGPGCRAGIDLMFLNKDGMTYEECIFWVRDNQDSIFGPLGYKREEFWSAEEPWDQCMNVMQLENMYCESSKNTRCKQALMRGDKPRGKVSYDGNGVAYKKRCDEVVLGRGSVNILDRLKKPE
uniref:5-hmdU DNA kinase helical domain-containing protein n=1 Tax=Salmonella phage vB_STmST313_KE31 TaxID=3161181 RepID=A0AAU8GIT6_9CAUD